MIASLRSMSAKRLGGLLVLALIFLIPAFVNGDVLKLQEYEYVLSFVLVCIGLNVVTGFAGLLSLGPTALFGIGGYAAVIVANDYPGVGLLGMCVVGTVAAGLAGLIIAIPTLRISGFYLAISTLFVALLVPAVANNLSLTGTDVGISLLANPNFSFSISGTGLYELIAVIVALTIGLSWLLLHSRIGHRFLTMSSSEELAASLGMPTYRIKILAFVLSSLPAGLGGALYVYSQGFFSPGSVTQQITIYLLAGCVVGGFGTIYGPVVGGCLLIGLSQSLGSVSKYQGVIFGLILIFFAVAFPVGIVGLLTGRGRKDAQWWHSARGMWNRFLVWVEESSAPRSFAQRETRTATTEAAAASAATDPDTLLIEGAEKSFGGVRAVAGVNLSISPGTVHGLIGSNGSGKTTLLNLISGFYRMDAGTVTFGGQTLSHLSAPEIARAGIARTFQTPLLVRSSTVLANVTSAAEQAIHAGGFASMFRLPAARRADRAAREVALDALMSAGLRDVADVRVGELPHGLQRLVEIARCIALRPKVLMLDEPGAGLSAREIVALRSLITEVAGAGVGVLLIEHNVPLVLELADEVTVLHQGTVIAHGEPSYVGSHPEVVQSFLGRSQATFSASTGEQS